MKSIARDASEPIEERYKSNLKLAGEEVSIRKPKKLLVSKNFADTLASKYEEETNATKVEEFVIPPVAPAESIVNIEPEKEDILNKTIEIPTFEELQARNKNIENVIKSTKPEVVPTAPIIEEKPIITEQPKIEPVMDNRSYKEQFKAEVEPLLMGVYEKQMKHIEELEEELSKTKYDLFEKQKEALSLKKENEEMHEQSNVLKQELQESQNKMNGILNVIQGNNKD